MAQSLAYAQTRRPHFLTELQDFTRFPSVSAQPQQAGKVKRCAAWLVKHLRRISLEQGYEFEV